MLDNGGEYAIEISRRYDLFSYIRDSKISSNQGHGIHLLDGSVLLRDSEVSENGKSGVYILSSNKMTIDGGTVIRNNQGTEVRSTHAGFPFFDFRQYSVARPLIYDIDYVQGTLDQYLLYVFDHVDGDIECRYLDIVKSDEDRFYPSFNKFTFLNPWDVIGAKDLYSTSMRHIIDGNFLEAYDGFKEIIDLYPDSEESSQALAMIPYVHCAIYDDKSDLYLYIESIDEAHLQDQIKEITGQLLLQDEHYIEV